MAWTEYTDTIYSRISPPALNVRRSGVIVMNPQLRQALGIRADRGYRIWIDLETRAFCISAGDRHTAAGTSGGCASVELTALRKALQKHKWSLPVGLVKPSKIGDGPGGKPAAIFAIPK